MLEAAVVEDHIHYHLQAFLMTGINQLSVLLVGTETRINTVVVGTGIAVIGGPLALIRRVVLQNRGEPKCRNTQLREIVQVLHQTFQVTAVTKGGSGTVFTIVLHAFHLRVVVSALCKTVRHQQIEHITDIEALALVTAHLTLFQLVADLLLVEV